jgi:hypothetical protein
LRTPTAPLLGWLLLKDQRKPADSLPFEGDIHFDAVGDLDEWYATAHPVVLAQRSLSFRDLVTRVVS